MQVSATQLTPVLLELSVEVDAERVRVELERAYQELSRGARVRGYRPGKAPRRVLRHMYGARVAADVAQRLVDATYDKAVSEQKVQAVSKPAIESKSVAENEPFAYRARLEVLPRITAVSYTGFKVQRAAVKVDDSMIDGEIQSAQRANSTLEPAPEGHAAESGDTVIVDVRVSVEGEEVADARAEELELELGSGSVLPALESELLGKTAPCECSVEVQMPGNASLPKLRGKQATFELAVKDIKLRVLPQIDDEFAKDLGDFEDLAALRLSLTKDLEAQQSEAADNALAQALVVELVKANPIEAPPTLVQQQARVTEQEIVAQARAQGRSGQLGPEDRQRVSADAEIKVKAGLLMAEVAKDRGLKIGEAEIEEGLASLAEQTGKNIQKLRAEHRDPQKREMLVGMILENKVLDILEQEAEIEQQAS